MKTLTTLISLLILTSCAQQKKEANNLNPIEKTQWMKDFIKQTEENPFPTKAMIVQYTYNNETVYLVDQCYQCPDAISTLYNIKKERLCTFGGMIPNTNNCPDFFDKATNKKILWKNFDK
ncbi:DUF6970 domain-containing protein [Tenacibaculum sp. IB213877]|uniref:DUF6970 domain-containing protein n=1 Tax=Tenacibaculum sp. IB213877 TaxID=3097351 RepID=UPI002A5A5A5F|nr:hypothetical protein [Tenacibaculum sp. IB213877]MDY0780451.1 hypothetical protein [Tenacibaculum sp. IB213877]